MFGGKQKQKTNLESELRTSENHDSNKTSIDSNLSDKLNNFSDLINKTGNKIIDTTENIVKETIVPEDKTKNINQQPIDKFNINDLQAKDLIAMYPNCLFYKNKDFFYNIPIVTSKISLQTNKISKPYLEKLISILKDQLKERIKVTLNEEYKSQLEEELKKIDTLDTNVIIQSYFDIINGNIENENKNDILFAVNLALYIFVYNKDNGEFINKTTTYGTVDKSKSMKGGMMRENDDNDDDIEEIPRNDPPEQEIVDIENGYFIELFEIYIGLNALGFIFPIITPFILPLTIITYVTGVRRVAYGAGVVLDLPGRLIQNYAMDPIEREIPFRQFQMGLQDIPRELVAGYRYIINYNLMQGQLVNIHNRFVIRIAADGWFPFPNLPGMNPRRVLDRQQQGNQPINAAIGQGDYVNLNEINIPEQQAIEAGILQQREGNQQREENQQIIALQNRLEEIFPQVQEDAARQFNIPIFNNQPQLEIQNKIKGSMEPILGVFNQKKEYQIPVENFKDKTNPQSQEQLVELLSPVYKTFLRTLLANESSTIFPFTNSENPDFNFYIGITVTITEPLTITAGTRPEIKDIKSALDSATITISENSPLRVYNQNEIYAINAKLRALMTGQNRMGKSVREIMRYGNSLGQLLNKIKDAFPEETETISKYPEIKCPGCDNTFQFNPDLGYISKVYDENEVNNGLEQLTTDGELTQELVNMGKSQNDLTHFPCIDFINSLTEDQKEKIEFKFNALFGKTIIEYLNTATFPELNALGTMQQRREMRNNPNPNKYGSKLLCNRCVISRLDTSVQVSHLTLAIPLLIRPFVNEGNEIFNVFLKNEFNGVKDLLSDVCPVEYNTSISNLQQNNLLNENYNTILLSMYMSNSLVYKQYLYKMYDSWNNRDFLNELIGIEKTNTPEISDAQAWDIISKKTFTPTAWLEIEELKPIEVETALNRIDGLNEEEKTNLKNLEYIHIICPQCTVITVGSFNKWRRTDQIENFRCFCNGCNNVFNGFTNKIGLDPTLQDREMLEKISNFLEEGHKNLFYPYYMKIKEGFGERKKIITREAFYRIERLKFLKKGRDEIQRLFTSGTLKQCPGCNKAVLIDSGCADIRCECGYNFCYICGEIEQRSHDQDHFLEYNEFNPLQKYPFAGFYSYQCKNVNFINQSTTGRIIVRGQLKTMNGNDCRTTYDRFINRDRDLENRIINATEHRKIGEYWIKAVKYELLFKRMTRDYPHHLDVVHVDPYIAVPREVNEDQWWTLMDKYLVDDAIIRRKSPEEIRIIVDDPNILPQHVTRNDVFDAEENNDRLLREDDQMFQVKAAEEPAHPFSIVYREFHQRLLDKVMHEEGQQIVEVEDYYEGLEEGDIIREQRVGNQYGGARIVIDAPPANGIGGANPRQIDDLIAPPGNNNVINRIVNNDDELVEAINELIVQEGINLDEQGLLMQFYNNARPAANDNVGVVGQEHPLPAANDNVEVVEQENDGLDVRVNEINVHEQRAIMAQFEQAYNIVQAPNRVQAPNIVQIQNNFDNLLLRHNAHRVELDEQAEKQEVRMRLVELLGSFTQLDQRARRWGHFRVINERYGISRDIVNILYQNRWIMNEYVIRREERLLMRPVNIFHAEGVRRARGRPNVNLEQAAVEYDLRQLVQGREVEGLEQERQQRLQQERQQRLEQERQLQQAQAAELERKRTKLQESITRINNYLLGRMEQQDNGTVFLRNLVTNMRELLDTNNFDFLKLGPLDQPELEFYAKFFTEQQLIPALNNYMRELGNAPTNREGKIIGLKIIDRTSDRYPNILYRQLIFVSRGIEFDSYCTLEFIDNTPVWRRITVEPGHEHVKIVCEYNFDDEDENVIKERLSKFLEIINKKRLAEAGQIIMEPSQFRSWHGIIQKIGTYTRIPMENFIDGETILTNDPIDNVILSIIEINGLNRDEIIRRDNYNERGEQPFQGGKRNKSKKYKSKKYKSKTLKH